MSKETSFFGNFEGHQPKFLLELVSTFYPYH